MRTELARPLPPWSRGGFTLVELLVVISLIAVLAAVSAGAFFRIRAAQESTNTEATLNKLHSMLDVRWKGIVDEAKKDVPTGLVTACGDKDRAVSIWTHAKLKNEFPQTLAEAATPISVGYGAPTLQPRKVFTNVTNSGTAELQSAALFYTALVQTGNKGNASGLDGLQQQIANDSASGLTYFRDSWGRPILLFRHANSGGLGEFDGPSYTRANVVKIGGTPMPINTMLDPLGKLIPTNPWTSTNATMRTAILLELNKNLPANPPTGAPSITFDNLNTLPTLVSGGPDKEFGNYFASGDDATSDNIVSIRLRREGARGD